MTNKPSITQSHHNITTSTDPTGQIFTCVKHGYASKRYVVQLMTSCAPTYSGIQFFILVPVRRSLVLSYQSLNFASTPHDTSDGDSHGTRRKFVYLQNRYMLCCCIYCRTSGNMTAGLSRNRDTSEQFRTNVLEIFSSERSICSNCTPNSSTNFCK